MLFESNVRAVFGLNAKGPPADAVGVEIEMELAQVVDLSPVPTVGPGWSVKSDGSLRNFGIEFVSEPTSVSKGLSGLLGGWDNLLSHTMLSGRIEDCPRASVHVHVNVREYSYNQLMNAIVAYTLLEGVLVAYCGRYRLGNLFALRIPEASTNFDHLIKRTKKYASFRLNGDHRYGALNLCSVSRFGTIEFRSMGPVYDPRSIDLWVNGLHHMVDHAARQFKNPPDVYRRYSDLSRREFITEFLGPLAPAVLAKGLDVDALSEEGEEHAIMLLASHPDNWTYETDFRNDKEFIQICKDQFGYRDNQILALDIDQVKTIRRDFRNSTPTIDPVSSDFQNWVPFSEDGEEPRRTTPRGEVPFLWAGRLPVEAFRNDEDWEEYHRDADNTSETSARGAAYTNGWLRPTWVVSRTPSAPPAVPRTPRQGVSFGNPSPGSIFDVDLTRVASLNVSTNDWIADQLTRMPSDTPVDFNVTTNTPPPRTPTRTRR